MFSIISSLCKQGNIWLKDSKRGFRLFCFVLIIYSRKLFFPAINEKSIYFVTALPSGKTGKYKIVQSSICEKYFLFFFTPLLFSALCFTVFYIVIYKCHILQNIWSSNMYFTQLQEKSVIWGKTCFYLSILFSRLLFVIWCEHCHYSI